MIRQIVEKVSTNLGVQHCYLHQFQIREDWQKDIDNGKYISNPAPILDVTTGEPIPGTGDVTREDSSYGFLPSQATRSMSGTIRNVGNCAPYAFYVANLITSSQLTDSSVLITEGYGGAYLSTIVEFLNKRYDEKNKNFTYYSENTSHMNIYNIVKRLEETLINLLPGYYTFLTVTWRVGGGHIFLIHKNPHDNKLYCLEPQLKSQGNVYYFPIEKMQLIDSFNTFYSLKKGELSLGEEQPLYIHDVYDTHYLTGNIWGQSSVVGIYKDYGEHAKRGSIIGKNRFVKIKHHGEEDFGTITSVELNTFQQYMIDRQNSIAETITASFQVSMGQFTTITEIGKIKYPDRDGYIVMCNNDFQQIYFSPIEPTDLQGIYTKGFGILYSTPNQVKLTNCFQYINFRKKTQKALFVCIMVMILSINYVHRGYSYQNLYSEFFNYINQIENPEELRVWYDQLKKIYEDPSQYDTFFQSLLDRYTSETYIEQFLQNTQFSGLENGTIPNVEFIPETFIKNKMYGNCAIYTLYSLGMRSYEDARQNTECLASKAAGPATVETIQQFFRYYYPGFEIPIHRRDFTQGEDYRAYLEEEFRGLREGFLAPIFLYYGTAENPQGFHMTTIGRFNFPRSMGDSSIKLYILDTQSSHIGYDMITALEVYKFPIWRIDTFYKKYNVNMEPVQSLGFRPVTFYDDAFAIRPWEDIIRMYNENPTYTPEIGEAIYRASIGHEPSQEDPQLLYYINGKIYTRGIFEIYTYPNGSQYLPIVEIDPEEKYGHNYEGFINILNTRQKILEDFHGDLNTIFQQNNIPLMVQFVPFDTSGHYKIVDTTPDTTEVIPGVPTETGLIQAPLKTVNVSPIPKTENVIIKPARSKKKKNTVPTTVPIQPILPEAPFIFQKDFNKEAEDYFQNQSISDEEKYIFFISKDLKNEFLGKIYYPYIEELINKNPALVNIIHPENGLTFLMISIINNRIDIVSSLLGLPTIDITLMAQKKLSVNLRRIERGYNALDIAILFGKVEIVELLYQKYREFVPHYESYDEFKTHYLSAINIENFQPLHAYNLIVNHPEYTRDLNYPNIFNERDQTGNTFFMGLIRAGEYEMANIYLNIIDNLNPFIPNNDGYFPPDYITDESEKFQLILVTLEKLKTLYINDPEIKDFIQQLFIRYSIKDLWSLEILHKFHMETQPIFWPSDFSLIKIALHHGHFSFAYELYRHVLIGPSYSSYEIQYLLKYTTEAYNRHSQTITPDEYSNYVTFAGILQKEIHKRAKWTTIYPIFGGRKIYKHTRKQKLKGILKKQRNKTYRKKKI